MVVLCRSLRIGFGVCRRVLLMSPCDGLVLIVIEVSRPSLGRPTSFILGKLPFGDVRFLLLLRRQRNHCPGCIFADRERIDGM
jgi:hypothetical protein